MAKADAKNVSVKLIVKRCSNSICKSEFQDQKYGLGMRLHKAVTRHGAFSETQERCTVCFIRPHRLGGHGAGMYLGGWRYAAWPAWLPYRSLTLRG